MCVYVLVGQSEGKKTPGAHMHEQNDNIKIYIKKINMRCKLD
jgi:hypothetical protein